MRVKLLFAGLVQLEAGDILAKRHVLQHAACSTAAHIMIS
jgi:hypothetical protein